MKTLSFADREGIRQPVGHKSEIPNFPGPNKKGIGLKYNGNESL